MSSTAHHTCPCGARYSAAQWASLPSAGIQRVPATDDGPAYELELRNCVCGSTRAQVVHPSPTEALIGGGR